MRINELDWAKVPNHAVMVYIGRRKSGKTTNIIDTFYKKRKEFKWGLVFCGSKATVKDYEKHFPSSFIYYGYHSDVVARTIDKQERDVELGVAQDIFILVDDCMWAKKSILTDPNIRRLFMNGRHAHIFFVLSMQYCMDLHPSMRQQIDYTFLSREKNPLNRERLFKNYNVAFTSVGQFDSCMRQCTQNHETFVLNNGDSSGDLPEDNVFWWKAKYIPQEQGGRKFRVNSKGTWWRYHRRKYNPRHFMPKAEAEKGKGKESGNFTVTKMSDQKTRRKRIKGTGGGGGLGKKRPAGKDARKPLVLGHTTGLMPPVNSTHTPSAADWLRKQRDQNLGPRRPAFRSVDNNVRYVAAHI